jgi:NADP-dependent 3-hydroxy acid dehydrogenase YdfG
MEKWEGKVAVVTGASVGIGAALCRALVEAGMIVCGLSKRKDKMEVRSPVAMLFQHLLTLNLLAGHPTNTLRRQGTVQLRRVRHS